MALTTEQWLFIAHRLLAKSDAEAATRAGLHPQTVYNWKGTEPEFVREYQASFQDGIQVAKNYTRRLLGKAAQALAEGLEATRLVGFTVKVTDEDTQFIEREVPDHRARLEAAKLLFQTHSLLVSKTQLTGKDDGPVEFRNVQDLSDADLADIARRGSHGAADPTQGES